MTANIYDLSTSLANNGYEARPADIIYRDHKENVRYYCKMLDLPEEAFPDKIGLATETVTAITHAGTHFDSPYHFGPYSEGKKAKRIDEVPLEWCYGDGVVLDLRHRQAGETITLQDIKNALSKVGYTLKPMDIVLLMVLGNDQYLSNHKYNVSHPGIDLESLIWMLDQGIKVFGTDGWSPDKPPQKMKEEYLAGDKDAIWPIHFAGRKREYCHIEKLANLEMLPKPHGFKVATFPIKIEGAGAGWCRTVAIFE